MCDLKPPWGPGLGPPQARPHPLQFRELASGPLAWLQGGPVCLSCHLSSELRPGSLVDISCVHSIHSTVFHEPSL